MYSYFLLFLLIYILYRFVVGFVLPVMRASKTMQQKMRDMNQDMNNGQPPNFNDPINKKPGYQSKSAASKKSAPDKDYIEFEEIK